jgi:Mg2+ and Co2+ transporter CorA
LKSCTTKSSTWKITCSISRSRRAVFWRLLRKQLIVMRRYMTPQRDVYARLASERLPG